MTESTAEGRVKREKKKEILAHVGWEWIGKVSLLLKYGNKDS